MAQKTMSVAGWTREGKDNWRFESRFHPKIHSRIRGKLSIYNLAKTLENLEEKFKYGITWRIWEGDLENIIEENEFDDYWLKFPTKKLAKKEAMDIRQMKTEKYYKSLARKFV